MKETRSSESWRMVRVSPAAPNRTSWCATRPRTRRAWTRTPSTSAPRAPSSPVEVASGMGSLPASRRAAAITSAVRRAVPEGASALSGWCSSMTSTDSKKGAACAAKRIIKIAPIEKLGATSTPTPGASASHLSSWSRRARSKPVVPTTAWMPCPMQKRRLSITTPGWVKSTTTCAPARTSSSMSSPASTSATRSVSGAASTARQTSVPTFPRAPSTPTLMTGRLAA